LVASVRKNITGLFWSLSWLNKARVFGRSSTAKEKVSRASWSLKITSLITNIIGNFWKRKKINLSVDLNKCSIKFQKKNVFSCSLIYNGNFVILERKLPLWLKPKIFFGEHLPKMREELPLVKKKSLVFTREEIIRNCF